MVLKDDKGSILVLVMFTMVVLLVMATALVSISSTDLVHALRQEKKAQAFYLARSGADAVATYLIANPGQTNTLLSSGPGTGSLDSGDFSVTVEPGADGGLLITSTGYYEGVASRVTLELLRTTGELETPYFDRAVFSNSDLNISHPRSEVHGDVESRGTITGNPAPGYQKFTNSQRVYSSPSFPDDIAATAAVLNVGNHQFAYINNDGYYKRITVNPDGTLYINTGGGIVRVVVEDITVQGTVQIIGGGRLLLYVLNSALMQTPHSSTAGGSLVVFVQDGKYLQTIAHAQFNGYVYAPNATVAIQSHAEFVGSIICNRLVNTVASGQRFLGEIRFIPLDESDLNDLIPFLTTNYNYTRGQWYR